MKKAEDVLSREFGTIRAGRANASLLSRVTVQYYGVETPINQVAAITVPEPRVILVTPFDKSSLEDVEKGILESDLGITPANDGSALRLVVPQLTEERRKELAKQVKAVAEQGKVAVRNVRREAMDALKKGHKNGDFTDDDVHDLEKQVQKVTDEAVKQIDKLTEDKEQEIISGQTCLNERKLNMANDDETVEITPGTPQFAKMVFKLNDAVTDENLAVLNYNGNELTQIDEGVYAQPAFVNDDFNLFFVITQLIEEDWIVAFSKATIENESEITDLSEPIPTGEGLNMLGEVSPDDANNLLQYFNTLSDANRGEWRLLQQLIQILLNNRFKQSWDSRQLCFLV